MIDLDKTNLANKVGSNRSPIVDQGLTNLAPPSPPTAESTPSHAHNIDLEISPYVLDFGEHSLPNQPEPGKSKVSAGYKVKSKRTPEVKVKMLRKLMSGTDVPSVPEYGKSIKLFGRREAAASDIARLLRFEGYPSIKIKKEVSDPNHLKNQTFLESSFVEGRPIVEVPAVIDKYKETQDVGQSVNELFKNLDQRSLHQAALFNWLIEHRDSHLGNMMVTPDNKVVPIDYGISMLHNEHEDKIPALREPRPCPIVTEYWRKHPDTVIPRDLLQQISKSRSKIYKIISEKVAPHYEESKRQALLQSFRDKLTHVQKMLQKGRDITVGEFFPETYKNRRDVKSGGTRKLRLSINTRPLTAHIKYKNKYIGSLSFSKPSKDNSGILQLTGKGNFDILKKIVERTRGTIEDTLYLKMLSGLLPKDFKVTYEQNNLNNEPSSFVDNVSLNNRRSLQ